MNLTQRIPDWGEIALVASSRGVLSAAPHLWKDVAALWPLQEPGGVKAFDVSGYGKHGTLTNTDPEDRIVGRKGRCVSLDGANEYILLLSNTSKSLLPDGSPFTLSMTVSLNQAAYEWDDYLFEMADQGWATEYTLALGVNGNGAIYTRIGDGDSSATVITSANSAMPLNQYVRLAVTREASGNVVIYKDGVSIKTGTAAAFVVNAANGNYATIGCRSHGSFGLYSAASINGVALHQRAFAPAEVAEDYADPWAMYRLRPSVFSAAVAEPVLTYRNYILGGGVI